MRAVNRRADEFDDCSIEALCFELVGQVESTRLAERSRPKWLDRAAEMLREAAAGGAVERAATEAGVHPIHLTRSFRRFYRCTPGEFLRAHRVSRAANQLLKRRSSIAEIAADCAFADQSHLVRSFRRHFGMTPQQFRASLG